MKTIALSQQLFLAATHKRLIPWLLIALLMLAAAYVYLFYNSMYQLNERSLALKRMGELETEIAVLETRSIALLGQVNFDLAKSLGFVELTQEPVFARRGDAFRLSLLVENEI